MLTIRYSYVLYNIGYIFNVQFYMSVSMHPSEWGSSSTPSTCVAQAQKCSQPELSGVCSVAVA